MKDLLLLGLLVLLQCILISSNVPIYWLNLDEKTDRRQFMERHLQEMQVSYHKRISALTPATCNLIMIDNFCTTGHNVVAVLCSHVNVLYEALHDPAPAAKASPYFLVLEDDIRFLYDIDWAQLIAALPNDFGSVQLMLSHKVDIETAWRGFRSQTSSPPQYASLKHRNGTMWSAQAILYRKAAIAPFVEYAVKKDRQGRRGFKLSHSFEFERFHPHQLNRFRPTIASKCLHSDTFLYAMSTLSYAWSSIPLFNSVGLGRNSSLHDDHVQFHNHGFAAIDQISREVQQGAVALPSFLKRRTVADSTAKEEEVDWTALARHHPVAGKGIPKDFNIK